MLQVNHYEQLRAENQGKIVNTSAAEVATLHNFDGCMTAHIYVFPLFAMLRRELSFVNALTFSLRVEEVHLHVSGVFDTAVSTCSQP